MAYKRTKPTAPTTLGPPSFVCIHFAQGAFAKEGDDIQFTAGRRNKKIMTDEQLAELFAGVQKPSWASGPTQDIMMCDPCRAEWHLGIMLANLATNAPEKLEEWTTEKREQWKKNFVKEQPALRGFPLAEVEEAVEQ